MAEGHGVMLNIPFSTAECLAEDIYTNILPDLMLEMLQTLKGLAVRVDETPKSSAYYEAQEA